MTTASIFFESTPLCENIWMSWMPYSSAVRRETVSRRHWSRSRLASYTPIVMFVLPTSTAKSMATPGEQAFVP